MTDQQGVTFLDRTLNHLKKVWHNVSLSGRQDDEIELQADLPDSDLDRLQQWLQACIEGQGGEVAARARTAKLGEAYLALDEVGRKRFLLQLADSFDCDDQAIEQSIERWRDSVGAERVSARQRLQSSLEPPRLQLLKQFTELPEGVKFLVDMRAELLRYRREEPVLAALEADLKGLLIHWFDIGLLNLQQITWQSPAALLEKLIAYEAVHAIQSWEDLKNRLDSDRRCFAFFHPNMPGEPLIFVEVALVNGLADNVQRLLDESAPLQDLQQADTAIFYSISNAQQGLAGISFGNFLIKRVVGLLQQEFPALSQFATLSPIPGFMRWLAQQENEACQSAYQQLNRPQWWLDTEQAEGLKSQLQPIVARYLCKERKQGRRALDPVANFHLSNGAQVAQLNWLADQSDKGLQQSAGFMVNYRYQLDDVEQNSEQYLTEAKVAMSAPIANLLKEQ